LPRLILEAGVTGPNIYKAGMAVLLAGAWFAQLAGDLAASDPAAWPKSLMAAMSLGFILFVSWRLERKGAGSARVSPAVYRPVMLATAAALFVIIAMFAWGHASHYPDPWPQATRILLPVLLVLAVALIVINAVNLRRLK